MEQTRKTLETQIENPASELENKIVELGPWFHNLHLPDGTQTAPNHALGDFPLFKWEKIQTYIPENLNGWRALDIGCNAGFYCFELAKRGAHVIGIDIDDHYLKQARWAAHEFNLSDRIEFFNLQVYDLVSITHKFDLILFMGVFYHLRYPLLALDIVSNKFKKLLIFQTLTMPGMEIIDTAEDIKILEREIMLHSGFPKMAFIENTIEGDETNWWAPNHSAVYAMMRSNGLKITAIPAHEIYICKHEGKIKYNKSEMLAAVNTYHNKNRNGC